MGDLKVATYSPIVEEKLLQEKEASGEASLEAALTFEADPSDLIFHHTDHLTGSNVDTNDMGQFVEVLDYFPFGNVRLDETASGYENDYKYTGKELDEDTGLYYYGARYYNADIGRFVSVDPWSGDIKDPQSLNKYSYVVNNPIKLVDIYGAAPGDPFKSADEAAIDFGISYNAQSINKNLEYGASINQIVTPGGTFFTYSEPNIGTNNRVSVTNNANTIATIHTHSQYSQTQDDAGQNTFSPLDHNTNYQLSGHFLNGFYSYLVTPNGTLLRQFYSNNLNYCDAPEAISSLMPSDPNDPTRVNYIDNKKEALGAFEKWNTIKETINVFGNAVNDKLNNSDSLTHAIDAKNK